MRRPCLCRTFVIQCQAMVTRLRERRTTESLSAVVDDVATEPVSMMPGADLADEVVELRRQIDRLEAQWRRRVAEFDRRDQHRVDGAVSAGAWLRWRCRVPARRASRVVKEARALTEMPDTAEAFAAGHLPVDHMTQLVRARDRHPVAFLQTESTLVEAAQTLTLRDLRRLVGYWDQNLDPDAAIGDAATLYERRRLHASRSLDGVVHIDGMLDPVSGETVLAALDAVTAPMLRDADDERTPAQIRADALVGFCRERLDAGDLPTTGGEKPHITVIVDTATLTGTGPSGISELGADRTVIAPEVARMIGCDATFRRVVVDPAGEPLDVGRKTRLVTAAQRRALAVRDKTCRFPGCERPLSWCDAHHIRYWTHGGPTELRNLILLCRHHHTLIHTHGFAITGIDHQIRFHRPDGTTIEDPAPP
jgi:hypothetical protein